MTGGDSVFSCFKHQDVHDKAALEVKIKRPEAAADKPSSALVQGGDPELFHGIERRLAGLESRLAAVQGKSTPASDLEEKMKLLVKNAEESIKALLAEERARREESDAEAATRLKKLEQETAAIKADMDKFHIELSIVKEGVLGAADKAYREVHERLAALAGKLQGDVVSAAADKFSTLQCTWEAAAVEIHNAQKTAYCALEKCGKLDTGMFFWEHKAATLEKKYSQYVAEQPESGAAENNGTGSI